MARSLLRALLLPLTVTAAIGAGGLGSSPVQAAGPTDLAGVRALEAKALLVLLKLAMKEDARRQAWYLATRILIADPKNDEAEAALKKWNPTELEQANPPSKGFREKRDASLRQVGDAYAQFVREMQTKGSKPADTYGLVERALAYGAKAPDAAQALETAGQAWCGTLGALPKADVQAAFGTLLDSLAWTPEYEDAYLRTRILWPDARVVGLRDWRILGSTLEGIASATTLVAAVEAHFVKSLGSVTKDLNDKEDDPNWDLVVVPDVATYDKVAPLLFHYDDPQRTARVAAACGWSDAWRKRTLVSAKFRDVPWIASDSIVAGWIGRALAKRHLGPGGYGKIGRGAWLLDGIQGVYEGFKAKGPEGGDLDFTRCWRLAAARAVKARGALIPWPKFLELDADGADGEAKEDLKFAFDGAEREAKRVEVFTTQATAFVIGLWSHEGEKGLKKLAALIVDTFKRGRLPDVDKSFSWRPGTAVEAANQAIEPAPSK